jgi:hypothetical protein
MDNDNVDPVANPTEVAAVEANRTESVKPPISFSTMSPSDYSARVEEEKATALDIKAEAMKQRHTAELDALANKHAAESAALDADRDAMKKETEAVKLYAEMWQRQAAEGSTAILSEVDAMRVRHETERSALAKTTGFVILPPLIGGRTRPGYPLALPGHPWIRPAV